MRYIVPPASSYPARYAFVLRRLMARPVDRSGTLDFGVDTVTLRPLPAFDPDFGLDFGEICRQVARELCEASPLPITVLWSGGIDSTCALCAFLAVGAEVGVAFSAESLREYPEFHEQVVARHRLIRQRTQFADIGDYLRRNDASATHVTGEIADQIYFINYPGHGLGSEELFSPPGTGLPEACLELYRPLVGACPRPPENNYDLLWWENFALKYQSVQARIHLHAGRRLAHVAHFFEHRLFELWAMRNGHRVKCPGEDLRNHKYPARELIHELFPHPSVFLLWKRKSLARALGRPAAGRPPRPRAEWYIDERWNVVAH